MLSSVNADPPMARKASFRTASRSRISSRSQIIKNDFRSRSLGPLAIADVYRRRIEIPHRQRRAHARIHPAAQQHHNPGFHNAHHSWMRTGAQRIAGAVVSRHSLAKPWRKAAPAVRAERLGCMLSPHNLCGQEPLSNTSVAYSL